MAIKTEHSDYVIYSTGHLHKVGDSTELEGYARNESGAAMIYVWVDRDGRQVINADTVRDGRMLGIRQERTPCDHVSNKGVIRVVHKWLRSL